MTAIFTASHFPLPSTHTRLDHAAVVFEERWDKGEHFRSGCVWQVGKGRVFYFRPGHETYPVNHGAAGAKANFSQRKLSF